MNIKDIKKGQTVQTNVGIGSVGEVVTEGYLAPFVRVDLAKGRQDMKAEEIIAVLHEPDDPEVLPEVAKPPRVDMDDPREED